MIVRVVKGRKQTDYPCNHVRSVTWDDGLDVIIYDHKDQEMRTIQLPEDGNRIHYMNDKGDTTHTLHWPPRHDREQLSERELRV